MTIPANVQCDHSKVTIFNEDTFWCACGEYQYSIEGIILKPESEKGIKVKLTRRDTRLLSEGFEIFTGN